MVEEFQAGPQLPPPPPPLEADVVTLIAPLCAELPKESLAETLKLNVVDAASPDTLKLVLPVVPIEFPFWNTV